MSNQPDYVVAAWVYINNNPDLLNQWRAYLQSHSIETKTDLNKAACMWLKNIYISGKGIVTDRPQQLTHL
jgi:hypothetical protein